MSKTDRISLFVLCIIVMFISIRSLAGDSFCYSITYNDKVYQLIPRPDLGYVVQLPDDTDSISILNETIGLFDETDIKKVGGLEKHRASVVFNKRAARDNEGIVEALKADSRIKFAAPLFSLNGQTVVVIPEVVVRISERADLQTLEELCDELELSIIKKMEFTDREYLLEVLALDVSAVISAVEQLKNNSLIEWTALNIAFEPQLYDRLIPNDEYFDRQWHLCNTGQTGGIHNADVNAPGAWEITTGDPNIIVAILDTGVDANHPDLINNMVPGYDFIDNDAIPEPGRFWVNDAHGTSCAGLVAAQGNNGIGVAGIAWNCKIMPIRMICDYVFITHADVASAIRWAAHNGADVLSNSWGTSLPLPEIIHSAISDITIIGGIGRDGKGCVVLCASGNWGTNQPVAYPAAYPEVIAVGATNHHDEIWYYSCSGPELDIVAPSGDVPSYMYNFSSLGELFQWTTDITGIPGFSFYNMDKNILDYSDTMGGTSGACPVVAGVAALVLSVNPNLTNEQVKAILIESAVDLGEPGFDEKYGYGRVDACVAVKLAMNPHLTQPPHEE